MFLPPFSKVFVNRLFPFPGFEAAAVQLLPLIISGCILDPSPILVLKDYGDPYLGRAEML